MVQPRKYLSKPVFWLLWVVASAFGWGAGLAIGNAVLALVRARIGAARSPGLLVVEILTFGMVGTAIGFMQWLVLRQGGLRAGWWIAASGVGMALAYFLGVYVAFQLGLETGTILGGILFGGIIGFFQGPVLWRRLPHLLLWMTASALGMVVGFGVGNVTGWAVGWVENGIVGTLSGAITGLVLLLLAWQRMPNSRQQPGR